MGRSDRMYPYSVKEKEIQKNSTKGELAVSADIRTVSEMLADAVNDEAGDFAKYSSISEMLTDRDDAETVKSMSYDEFKHKRIFEEIYHALNGSLPDTVDNTESSQPAKDLLSELSDSLFSELEAVEMYREIMAAFGGSEVRDMIFEIITDEQAHADILNYLIAKLRG